MTATGGSSRTVAVVGAGVVGATVSLELARRDIEVTLYDAGTVASGSSGRAAGVCYDAFADGLDADLAARSLEVFRERDALVDCPYVWLAREGDDRNAAAMDEQVPRMQGNGRDVGFVDPDELAARWPTLRIDDVARAAIARNAGLADPGAYTRETAQLAVAEGATLRTDTPIELDTEGRIRVVDGRPGSDRTGSRARPPEYDAVVVSAGAHTARLLGGAGLPVAVKAYRVQALLTDETPLADGIPTLYDATGGFYLRPRDGRLFVGDGTVPEEHDPDEWERSADDWFRAEAADALRTALAVDTAALPPIHRAWAGLCTATPDGDPLVGEVAPGLLVATGFQGHGFMRAPAIGERLAGQIIGGEAIDAFDPTRFSGDEEFEIVEGMTLEEPGETGRSPDGDG